MVIYSNQAQTSILQFILSPNSAMKCNLLTIYESKSLCKTEIDENHRVVICAKHDAFVLPQGDQMITHYKKLR